jgi:hypothetical protein
MPEEIELAQAESFGEESDESTSVEVPKRGRKPDSAYRQLQSERDTALARAQAYEQRLQALETRDQQNQRHQAEGQLMAQIQQLPEEQQQQALINYRVQQWQAELANERYRRQQAEEENLSRKQNDRLMLAAAKEVKRRDLPDFVGKVPIENYLLLHARTVEEVKEQADALAEQFGSGGSKASASTPRRPSRYANADGATAPAKKLADLTPNDPEFAQVWQKIRRGDITIDDARRGRWK